MYMNHRNFQIKCLKAAGYTEEELEMMDLTRLTDEIVAQLIVDRKYSAVLQARPNPILKGKSRDVRRI